LFSQPTNKVYKGFNSAYAMTSLVLLRELQQQDFVWKNESTINDMSKI